MWLFWILAGTIAAALAAVVMTRAARAGTAIARQAEDPALPVYRRQLSELDDLAARGLLGPEEHQAARAEAARRLLSAAETRRAGETPGGPAARRIVAIATAAAGLTALCLYLLLGAPGVPDQPYRARLRMWRDADPSSLDAPRMAAVLREIVRQRPNDPQALDYLGRAELASGEDFAAAQAFQRAANLAPGRADLWAALGEALMAGTDGGTPAPKAEAAFRQALALDPRNAPARYFLGRAEIADGQTQAGLALWRGLQADLPDGDPRRIELSQEIQHVATGAPPSGPGAPSGPVSEPASASAEGAPPPAVAAGQMSFIRGMVAQQAAALKAHPDDPDGWARLVRSYGVLGDAAAQQQALAAARRLYHDRPDVLARIQGEATRASGPAPAPAGMPGG